MRDLCAGGVVRRSWWAALLGVAMAVVVASPARAHCGDDCSAPLPYWIWPSGWELAADGVLVFPVGYGRAASALGFFSLQVVDDQGLEVPGTIEVNEAFSLLVWRPALPWTPGASYFGVSRIDTAGWAEALYEAQPNSCVTHDYEFELTIAAEGLPAPAMPPIVIESTHAITRIDRLDAVVCCDGAMPYLEQEAGHCGYDLGYDVWYSEGSCARLREFGGLTVTYAIDREALPVTTQANLAARLTGPSDDWVRFGDTATLGAPGCLRFEVLDVARGQVFVDERCHGEDLAEVLGEIERDPTAELAACEGQPYVCAGTWWWDPEMCVAWPGGQAIPKPGSLTPPLDEGVGCRADAPGGAGGPMLVALGLLAARLLRRRRR